MTMREEFKAAMAPILGDNPNWRESGDGELAWQAWQAATERAAKVCEDLARKAGRNHTTVGSMEGDDGYQCAAAIRGTT